MGKRENYYIIGVPFKDWLNMSECLEINYGASFEIQEEIEQALNNVTAFPMVWTVVQLKGTSIKVNYFESKEKAKNFIDKYQGNNSATKFYCAKANYWSE